MAEIDADTEDNEDEEDEDDEFDVDSARECVLGEIAGCDTCQPWDGGDVVWLGPTMWLSDILQDCDVPETRWHEVLEDLTCPHCGKDLNDPYEEVMVKSDYDKRVENVFEDIKAPELMKRLRAFNDFLKEFPYLGVCDPDMVGEEILNKMDKWGKYELLPRPWYRARRLDSESRIFRTEEMGVPDPRKVYVREGRYNHTGQSFLYLADNPDTAFHEIKEGQMNICCVQTFLPASNFFVLDLRQDYLNMDPDRDLLALALIYNGFVSKKPGKETSWKPEYFVSRFVADCARKQGYEGILFTSVANYPYENLVVFPGKIDAFKPDGPCLPLAPKKEEPRDGNPPFLDFSDLADNQE